MATASQSTTALHREEVLTILAAHQEELRRLGVKSLALFGSVVRNEARSDSDVDLLIEFEEGHEPQGLEYFGFNQHFEKLLGREVDLADPHRLKPRIRDRILAQAIPIFPSQLSYKANRHFMPEPSSDKDWKLYIDDMLQSASRVVRATLGLTFEALQKDEFRLLAVERCLITIGEAADKILKTAPEIIQRYPDIPWNLMKGMRNHLVHGYDRVDVEKIRLAVEESVPCLIPQLEQLLERENSIAQGNAEIGKPCQDLGADL